VLALDNVKLSPRACAEIHTAVGSSREGFEALAQLCAEEIGDEDLEVIVR
jgi:hypothetical protein